MREVRIGNCIEIRVASESDCEGVVSLLDRELRKRDWFCPRQIVYRWVTGDNGDGTRRRPGIVYVAIRDREIVGVAIGSRRSRVLFTLLVDARFRGLGIGRALVRAVAPFRVRVKRDMTSGDPAGFWERLGYSRGSYTKASRIEVWSNLPELPL